MARISIIQHARLDNFPTLREILAQLLFAPEIAIDSAPSAASTPATTPVVQKLAVRSTPRERYHLLSPKDKVAVLSFMCNLAVSSKAIHVHMETCEEQLTDLRKQKIDVNRSKKQ